MSSRQTDHRGTSQYSFQFSCFHDTLHSRLSQQNVTSQCFFVLPQPMKPLKATATTSKPVLTLEQIDTIFFMIQDIFEIHKEFYDALSPNIQQWDEKVTVGHLFQKLVSARRQRCAPSMLSFVGRANYKFANFPNNFFATRPVPNTCVLVYEWVCRITKNNSLFAKSSLCSLSFSIC